MAEKYEQVSAPPNLRLKLWINYGYYLLVVISCSHSVAEYWQRFSNAWRWNDFSHYYGTSWLFAHDRFPYRRDFLSIPEASRFDWDPLITGPTNPPSLTLLTLPLAYVEPQTAWLMWQAFLLISLLGCSLIMPLLFGKKLSLKIVCLTLCLLVAARPLAEGLLYSQIQPFLFFLLLAGTLTLVRAQLVVTGLLWGAAISLKLYLWPLLLFLFGRRCIRGGVTGILVIFFLAIVSSLCFGWSIWQEFWSIGIEQAYDYATRPVINYGLPPFICNVLGALVGSFATHSLIHITTTLCALVVATAIWRLGKLSLEGHTILPLVAVVATISTLALPTGWYHAQTQNILGLGVVALSSGLSISQRHILVALTILLMLFPINAFGSGRPYVSWVLSTIPIICQLTLALLCFNVSKSEGSQLKG